MGVDKMVGIEDGPCYFLCLLALYLHTNTPKV